MQFGNWNISKNSISWSGGGENNYIINNENLLEIADDGNGVSIYKSIMQATDQDWLTEDELYDLNFAFVYQAGATGASFEYEIFDNTLDYQFNLLDDDNEE